MTDDEGGGARPLGGRLTWRMTACGLALTIGAATIGLRACHDPPEWWIFNTRGKWKRTMADMGQVATALESHARGHAGAFPVGEGAVESLRGQLEPTYAKRLPAFDAWDRPLLFRSDGVSYELRSLGRDGRQDSAAEDARVVDQDLVVRDGAFLESDILVLMMSERMSL